MYTRHDEVPVLARWQGKVEAEHYNRVVHALKRLGPSLRIKLPGLKTLELILQEEAWIVVDSAFNDVPVVAWTGFQSEQRAGLQQPVVCELRYFHAHAAIILKQVLALMDERLDQLLAAGLEKGDGSHLVIDFPARE
jgi:hypothetical protein